MRCGSTQRKANLSRSKLRGDDDRRENRKCLPGSSSDRKPLKFGSFKCDDLVYTTQSVRMQHRMFGHLRASQKTSLRFASSSGAGMSTGRIHIRTTNQSRSGEGRECQSLMGAQRPESDVGPSFATQFNDVCVVSGYANATVQSG